VAVAASLLVPTDGLWFVARIVVAVGLAVVLLLGVVAQARSGRATGTEPAEVASPV
jgi:hypothetical protein